MKGMNIFPVPSFMVTQHWSRIFTYVAVAILIVLGSSGMPNSLFNASMRWMAEAAEVEYQGFGTATLGGTGGTVVHITNLNDTGPGSLRDAVSQGNRTVIFDVGGVIALKSHLYVKGPFITIDGFTAPAPGITLRDKGLYIRGDNGAHDVIIRAIRVRNSTEDGIQVAAGATDVVIDHVSVHGSADGNLDITQNGTRDVTVSWSILAEPAGEEKNMLLAFKQTRVTLHHNLFIDAQQRNPQVTYDDSTSRMQDSDTTLDMRNNMIWDWRTVYGTRIRYGGNANIVNNFYSSDGGDGPGALIICKGLPVDSGCYSDTTNIARAYVTGNYSADGINLNTRGTEAQPFPAPYVDTVDACTAAYQILADAGVRPLDPIDQQYINTVSLPPCISVVPGRFDLSVYQAEATPFLKEVNITDPRGGSLSWNGSVTSDAWLTADLLGGTTPSTVTLTFDPSTLSIDDYTGLITISVQNAANSPVTIPVTLRVLPPPTEKYLTINRTGTGSGSITSNPPGINCGTDCSEPYVSGTLVVLTPTPAPDSTFAGWSGDPDCLNAIVTLDADKTCTAVFSKILPDLLVSTLSVPTETKAGSAISVTDTTKNQGTVQAEASTTKFYLSANATYDAGDVYLGSRTIQALSAGASSSGSTSLTIPFGATPGTCYIIAKADADNVVQETNESNNSIYKSIKIALPDLIIYSLTVPASAKAGSAISATDITKNQGTVQAEASTTKFYLSSNATYDAGDAYLGSRTIPALLTAASSSAATSLTIPSGTAAGTYYIIAKADADSVVQEANEVNNNTYKSIKIALADLIVYSLTVPASAKAGSAISAADITKNQGTVQAEASTTKFYLSANATYDAGDAYLGSRAIPALLTAGLSSAATSLTIPSGKAAGTYYIIAKADADSAVQEANEGNNNTYKSIKIGLPDLIIYSLTVPASAKAGSAISATDITKNQGTVQAEASTTKFYLSANATYDAGDAYLGSRAIPALLTAGLSSAATSLTIPSGKAAGTYYIIAKADADSAVQEANEGNNNTYKPITITFPDLIIYSLTVPASARPGAAISVTNATKNQGTVQAEASTTKFYLSANATYDAADVYLGSRTIPTLLTAGSSSAATSLTIPSGTAVGTYYIIAKADADSVVQETNEVNNTLYKVITISE